MKKFILRIKYSRMSLFDLFSEGLCKPTEPSIMSFVIAAEIGGLATKKTIDRWYKEFRYFQNGLQDEKTYEEMLQWAKAHINQ